SGTTDWCHWFFPQVLYPYHKSLAVFTCPSGARSTANAAYRGHYGANTAVISYAGTPGKAIAEILAPANTYMFMEFGVYNVDYGRVLAPLGGMYYLPGSAAALGLTAATVKPTAITNADLAADFEKGRHNGGINIAFADGHAKWYRVEAVID